MSPDATSPQPAPPIAERRPYVMTVHGDERVDDWYWVRDPDDPALLPLLEAENAYTAAATAHLKDLEEEIYQAILERTQLTDVTYPAPKGEWAYYVRTIDGKEHSISCRRPRNAPAPDADPAAVDADESVILDENLLAEGHAYLEVGDRALSHDQRLLAYAMDTTGGERMTIRFRDLESGLDLDDQIEGAYYGLAFAADNVTLFYTRPDDSLRPYQVWRHRLGDETGGDTLVFEENDERFFVGVGTTKDGRFVAIQVESSLTSEWLLVPSDESAAEPTVVTPRRHDVLYSIEHHDGELLILSNDGAVNFALFRAPLGQTDRASWQTLVPERDDVRIEQFDVIAGHVLVEERGHATTTLRLLDLATGDTRTVEAPPAGMISLAQNLEFDTTAIRYVTTSIIQPVTLYELDVRTGQAIEVHRQPVPGGYDPADYRTERGWATSADGTKVAVTLAWRADRPTGPGPAMLYGYGAYGASIDPVFSAGRPLHPLLDRHMTYAIAHVRGGEELGRRWYLDGKFEHKHHTFEDFVAVAHFLVDEGWTTPGQLVARGGSAGGLLVGASVNLDPDAFGAVIAEVPFVDCLTTMLDPSLPLTTNEWEEWGDPLSDPVAYQWIKAYAPYENIAPVRYPRMLVTGGLTDPRVGFFEPTKWVQKLRAAHPDNADRILYRIELSAGHFGPSGRYEAWRKWAFTLAFAVAATTGRLEPSGQPEENVTS